MRSIPISPIAAAIAAALLAMMGFIAAIPVSAATTDAVPSAEARASSNDLVENAKALDRTTLLFEGEAIGDPLMRGDHAWVNVSDGNYAIGIWLPRPDLARIERYGSYGWKGDRIRVTGEFHRACPDHGGDMDIHSVSIELIERGSPVSHPANATRIAFAAVTLATAAAAFAFWRRREKFMRPLRPPANRAEGREGRED